MSNQPSSFLAGTASGQSASIAAAQASPLGSADYNALFDQLLEFKWRGYGFPIVETALDLRHDLAIHKFVDRDGAHVEGTGRAPLQITVRVPFLNGLSRGKAELWNTPLYPGTWRKVFAACADKSSGIVTHPELGDITCKCETMNTRWSGDVRTGVFVTMSFIETDDDTLNFDSALASTSPVSLATSAAADLDDQVANFSPAVVPHPYSPPYTFTDLMQSIRSVFDQTTLLQKEFSGRIDNFIYQAQQLQDSVNLSVNASALNWPVLQAAEIAKSACYDIKATQLTKGKKQGQYTVLKDSTLAQVANSIGAPVSDIMSLNPAYVQFPVLPSGSVVRYYLVAV